MFYNCIISKFGLLVVVELLNKLLNLACPKCSAVMIREGGRGVVKSIVMILSFPHKQL